MEDLRSTYRLVLKKIEDFLKKGIEELPKETEKRLATLSEMCEILAIIIAEEGQVKEGASAVNQYIVLIVGLCCTLLFGPYTEFLTQLSDRSQMINEMEDKVREKTSGALPKFMQVKYDQVKSYLKKAEGRLKELDNMLSELVPKIKKAQKEKFKIPEEEIADLKMDVDDVNGELEKCKNYLTEAEKVLSTLQTDMKSERWTFGVKVVGAAARVAADNYWQITIGRDIDGPDQISKVVQLLGKYGPIIAGVIGLAALAALWFIIDRHKTSYRQYVDSLKMELEGLQIEYRHMESDINRKLTDRMKGGN